MKTDLCNRFLSGQIILTVSQNGDNVIVKHGLEVSS